jgi:pilus assembly protein CpaB
MKWRGILWWFGAAVSAMLAGLLTLGLLRNVAPAAPDVGVTLRPIVVAAVSIPFRRSIGEHELAIREVPADAVPEGAAMTLDQVIGKMSTVDLYANEPILVQQLVTPDIVTQQVALSVPDGKEVIVVPTRSKLLSNRLVRPGDRVDLLATINMEAAGQTGAQAFNVSVALLQDQEVHAVILPVPMPQDDPNIVQDQDGGILRTMDEQGESLLLAVDAQDALTVIHVLDTGGTIGLALRAPKDQSITQPSPVDQNYLINRYRISRVQ